MTQKHTVDWQLLPPFAEDIREEILRIPQTKVPAKETTYICATFQFDDVNADYHVIASEPILNNTYVMHHMLLYGCDDGNLVHSYTVGLYKVYSYIVITNSTNNMQVQETQKQYAYLLPINQNTVTYTCTMQDGVWNYCHKSKATKPVSYTHLTLPTNHRV